MDKFSLMSREELVQENQLMKAILQQIQLKQPATVKVLYVRDIDPE